MGSAAASELPDPVSGPGNGRRQKEIDVIFQGVLGLIGQGDTDNSEASSPGAIGHEEWQTALACN